MKKRLFAWLTALVILCSLLPSEVSADSTLDLVKKYTNYESKSPDIFSSGKKDTPKSTTKPTEKAEKTTEKPAKSAEKPAKTTTEPAKKAAPVIKTGNPPAMDEAFSQYPQIGEGTDGSGNLRLKYGYFTSVRSMKTAIEDYIEVLKEYGYTLVKTENNKDYRFSYWLDSQDSSLKTLTKYGHTSQLYIEGFSLDEDTNSIYVFYSPSIVDAYMEAGSYESSSQSRTSTTSPGSLPKHNTMCSKCHNRRTIPCSNCGGNGYKERRVPVPNYSGSGSRYATVKEDCYKCPPNGQVDCPKCSG